MNFSSAPSRHFLCRFHIRRITPICALVVAVFLLAQSIPVRAADKKDQQQGKLLYGKVLDQHDNPVPNAVVYLTNSRTHAVKTYIIGEDGTYRFPGLASVDYEVYAQINNRKSETKSLSQFDERSQVYVDLKINLQ
jgi:Carboxypeptidase regulatory-like domain